ncbi:16S rRNA (cytidine(1402)-2'-O)-methyltransferase [Pectinatus frisingensis]|jgi:16S rRNA (cytidine1402-2'-O)-methyltransferase|uniref:16S rRNA (cytidine(1402)-2'-O)-methyltransferase n=1 Tax=Pectinatus frisingensis TaxID=865 RepID=UPI0015F53BEB|nr:16S rRNA (cytidine(1402)-2'-O)-methyltransferase [Pectinatus frisingensis]
MTTNLTGILYLVGTPIGNLDDMSFRAVKVLQQVDLIAAEDTRHTRKLLSHFNIHVPLTSYHEHNKLIKGPILIEKLLTGNNIAVVSDAGLPGIADPGSHLAALAIQEDIQVSPVPGANAALTALIASGLSTVQFSFIGFLPKKLSNRKKILTEISSRSETLIFYETPHRLVKILGEMLDVFGEARQVSVCRELTKKFEQFIRGSLREINEYFDSIEPRGEYVLILEGCSRTKINNLSDQAITPVEYVHKLMATGLSKKEAIKKTADECHLSRRDIYAAVLQSEK